MKPHNWSRTALALWSAWIVAFAVLEAIGLSKKKDGWPPLTQVFRRYVPRWVTIPLVGWLLVHAIETYATPPKEMGL